MLLRYYMPLSLLMIFDAATPPLPLRHAALAAAAGKAVDVIADADVATVSAMLLLLLMRHAITLLFSSRRRYVYAAFAATPFFCFHFLSPLFSLIALSYDADVCRLTSQMSAQHSNVTEAKMMLFTATPALRYYFDMLAC